MLNKKEIFSVLIVTVIIALSISFLRGLEVLWYSLFAVFIAILVNIFAKKVSSYYLESEIEVRLWEISRFGFRPRERFKKPIPAGAILPVISKLIFFPLKSFIWMASLVFEIKPKVYRAARKHGLYTFSEMTEDHIGLIAASGIAANLVFAIIGYLVGFPEFSRINIYYAFFNMLPISNLDGNKIFFGNTILWSFLAALVFIGLFFSIFIV
jgi:Zn-dependent protease